MHDLRGAILVLAHSRANLLEELFESIKNLKEIPSVELIVVQQKGYPEVSTVITKNRDIINVLIETDGSCKTTPENIGRNRLSGYATAFNAMGLDWVLAVEEDIVLAPDTIRFCEYILNKYSNKKNFRGINLGSRIPSSDQTKNTYSETRFGIYGQGAVLTRRSWQKMQKYGVVNLATKGHWDSAMEAYMKTGLTIAPNSSRYVDRGWNGSHTPNDPMDPYYVDLNLSFVGNRCESIDSYKMEDIGYWWRRDLLKYKPSDNLKYWIIFLSRHQLVRSLYRKFKSIILSGNQQT